MKFNSQICTTREQSERLLSLGLKKETADMAHNKNTIIPKYKIVPVSDWGLLSELEEITYIPAWSLHRLLCMLPDDAPKIFWILDGASITIDVENDCITFFPHKGDLYKSVVDCIEWLIKEGYFNKEYLV